MSAPTRISDLPLFGLPPHNGTPTSRDGAATIAPSAGTIRAIILEAIRKDGPMTCEDVEERLGLKHQTASARIRELEQASILRICGTSRNRSGAMARLYEAVKAVQR